MTREELKAPILDYFKDINSYMNNCMAYDSLNSMLNRLIDASEERPHGEWIEVDIKPLPYGGYTCNYQCNNNKCNYFTREYHLNFCPNCGADMRKEGDTE